MNDKAVTLLVVGAFWTFVIVGCHSDDPPPIAAPAVINDQKNEVTKRQRLVHDFQTAEVLMIPYASNEFIVRDTNGCIWYVNTEDTDRRGKTRLFDPFESKAPSPPDYTMPSELNARDQAAVSLIQAMIDASLKATVAANSTNFYNVTNVYVTGDEPSLPPQMGGKIAVMINKRISEFARTNRVWAEDPVKK